MSRRRIGKVHNPYPQGGAAKENEPSRPLPKPARNATRHPGDRGHGSEGFSKGYGGSEGSGATEPSGPEREAPQDREK